MEDLYIEYLEEKYKETQTIADITRDTTVTYKGKVLKIGYFLADIRKKHKAYINGSTKYACASDLNIKRYEALERMGITWALRKSDDEKIANDKYIKYIREYYEKNKTLKNIPSLVEYEGETLDFHAFFSHRRVNHKNYLNGINKHGSMGPTELRRYQVLDECGFDWEPVKTRYEKEDLYISYLKEYYEEHHTINDITDTTIVEYRGQKLFIGCFLAERRRNHREFLEGKELSDLETRRQQELEDLEIMWQPKKAKEDQLLRDDICLRYLEEYYKENGTINDIPARSIVKYEGKTIKIGRFLSDARKKHISIEKGNPLSGSMSKVMQNRYQELEKLGIEWNLNKFYEATEKISYENGIRVRLFRKYIKKFDGDVEKALKICLAKKALKKQRQKTMKNSYNVGEVLGMFDITYQEFEEIVNRKKVEKKPRKKKFMVDEKTTLHHYCIMNGLNYNVIRRAVCLKNNNLCDEDLQSLINREICSYISSGQQGAFNWIYAKYGDEALLRHLLINMHLNSAAVMKDMINHSVSLEQAVENACFVKALDKEDNYLEPIYHKLVESYRTKFFDKKVTDEELKSSYNTIMTQLSAFYHLDEVELKKVDDACKTYFETIRIYHLYEVGFEKDPEKRVNKIINYRLNDEEIEEAYFMPLRFDKKVLLGEKSLMRQRREEVRELVRTWKDYSDDEKIVIKQEHHLTDQELKYVEESRSRIDTIITEAVKRR